MITKAQVKHIQSLDDKNYRYEHKQFRVEGDKMVRELIKSNLVIKELFALQDWIDRNQSLNTEITMTPIEPFELEKISLLTTPNKVLAIAELPDRTHVTSDWALLLDGIQDPGNLGSIVRIADWYDIPTIYCSESCADAYNAKVIQASMGSIFRIHVQKCDLEKVLIENKAMPVYVCVLDGTDVNSFRELEKGFIVIGNESKGVSEQLIALSQHRVSILRKGRAESLNAAVAAGIICHCMLS